MGFAKQAINADGDCGACEWFYHGPIAASCSAEPARFLYAVSSIKDHRNAQALHYGDGPHVVDESAIAKKRATLGDQNVLAPGRCEFGHYMLHITRRHELALLYVHGPPCFSGGDQEIGLPGQKCGNLQHCANFGGSRGLVATRGYPS